MKDTGQDLKGQFQNVVTHVKEMPRKKKIIWSSVIGGILVLAIGLTVLLNMNKFGYKVLYQGLETEEANTIYSMLQEMGVSARRNEKGEIVVPKKDYDKSLIELATKGYPKSAMTYNLFADHTGMTTTEAESKQWRLYQLQDRIQGTLKQMKPIQSAVVTINLPDEGTYVWEKTENAQKASASVLLNLSQDLSPQQVDGIKVLIAGAVPNLIEENVKVVNAANSQELSGTVGKDAGIVSAIDNLTFEKQVQSQIEENARRILEQRYGPNGVIAVARVELDYDKMITEQMELQPKEDGTGYITDFNEKYTLDGRVPPGGIVGEENNTDIPEQVIDGQDGQNGTTNYDKSAHYEYGYIKRQIEKGNAALKDASISVMVAENNMTQARRDELTALISTSTGIAAEDITVSPIDPNADVNDNEDEGQTTEIVVPVWVWIVLGTGVLVLILLGVVMVWLRNRAKRKQMEQQNEIDQQRAQMEQEIADYKKKLSDAAMSASNPKEEAIVSEVKEFAKQNPEITANLLRAWMKEGDD